MSGAALLAERPRAGAGFTVIQGSHRIARREDVVLSTLLGSCVAACLWDEAAQVGGMNHFLLPHARTADEREANVGWGAHAMELLINDLLKAGASRFGLRAKLFGGARIRAGLTDVGEQNAAFAERFLADEGIPVESSSLRGDRGRRLQFWPMSGRARQILMARDEAAPLAPRPVERPAPPTGGDLELF